jgi:hypothetical protein
MATRAQVAELRALGHSYEAIGRELGIGPGLALMIGTGLPADSSAAASPAELDERDVPHTGTQALVNPPAHNPTRNDDVMRWVQERAARELRQSD